MEIFSGANAVLSARHHMVGDERKERKDTRETNGKIDRTIGARKTIVIERDARHSISAAAVSEFRWLL
jgi:hypothetical protein